MLQLPGTAKEKSYGMEYREILRHWFAEENVTLSEIGKGISSNACRVKTGKGEYVLRRIAGWEQGEREASICRVLRGAAVVPGIVETPDGRCCVEADGCWYNLQEFLPGEVPELRDVDVIRQTARAVAGAHKQLRDAGLRVAGTDRFSTLEMLEKAGEDCLLIAPFFPESVDGFDGMRDYIRQAEGMLPAVQVIHGDLGAWNLLWNGEWVFLIDFGESRMGDPCLDLAAVLGSIVGVSEEQAVQQNVFAFLEAYEEIYGAVPRDRLGAACFLWQLRGALAAAVYLPAGDRRTVQIQRFYEHYTRIKRYL